MDEIQEEMKRLQIRLDDLKERIVPELESKSEQLYARIMPLPMDSEQRRRLENEYTILSKELTLRSSELFNARQAIENLEFEQKAKKRRSHR